MVSGGGLRPAERGLGIRPQFKTYHALFASRHLFISYARVQQAYSVGGGYWFLSYPHARLSFLPPLPLAPPVAAKRRRRKEEAAAAAKGIYLKSGLDVNGEWCVFGINRLPGDVSRYRRHLGIAPFATLTPSCNMAG